jgi:hypothetical protein
MTEPLNLDWSTAEVSDGTLTIALDAKPPKPWRDVFERTATMLGAHWEVTLRPKKGLVEIATVRTGDEERVRQLLEGIVQEANSRAADEPAEDEDASGDGPSHEDAPERSSDETLTDHFRGFADDPNPG